MVPDPGVQAKKVGSLLCLSCPSCDQAVFLRTVDLNWTMREINVFLSSHRQCIASLGAS